MEKKKVLIIDDEVDFCLLMQFYLSKKNCDVSISHTLSDGLGILQSKSPDIVILDNNLPDGLGWPEAKNILAKSPEVQLFLISANKPTSKPDEINNSHLQVVEKPISISQIDNFLKSPSDSEGMHDSNKTFSLKEHIDKHTSAHSA